MKTSHIIIIVLLAVIGFLILIQQRSNPNPVPPYDYSKELKENDSLKNVNDSLLVVIKKNDSLLIKSESSLDSMRVKYLKIKEKYENKIKNNSTYTIIQLDSVIFASDDLLR
jgi:hypothetical protein